MKEIIARFKSETPKFFKRLRNLGLSLSFIGGGLVVLPYFPDSLKTYAQNIAWVGGAIALVSQTATTKPENLPTNN